MPNPFEAVKLTDRVYWVGAIDWEIRNFHGYATDRGTTYNAYLVLGEKNILVDTVKSPFHDEFMARVSSVIDPERIDVLVSNHSEMDHSGCLPRVLRAIRPERVIASTMGEKALRSHFEGLPEITVAKDGERLEIGDAHLTFVETRMLHWPDSMFSYLEEEKILFSQDACS
jgi:flavorubredoxin